MKTTLEELSVNRVTVVGATVRDQNSADEVTKR